MYSILGVFCLLLIWWRYIFSGFLITEARSNQPFKISNLKIYVNAKINSFLLEIYLNLFNIANKEPPGTHACLFLYRKVTVSAPTFLPKC